MSNKKRNIIIITILAIVIGSIVTTVLLSSITPKEDEIVEEYIPPYSENLPSFQYFFNSQNPEKSISNFQKAIDVEKDLENQAYMYYNRANFLFLEYLNSDQTFQDQILSDIKKAINLSSTEIYNSALDYYSSYYEGINNHD